MLLSSSEEISFFMVFIFIQNLLLDINKFVSQMGEELELVLKQALQEAITLAKKHLKKQHLVQLQALLVDYHTDLELANILQKTLVFIHTHDTPVIEPQENSDQYHRLEEFMQKHEAAIRKHIQNEQQLKIYCEDLQQKNKELTLSNQQLLKSTKNSLCSLKKENERIVSENIQLSKKLEGIVPQRQASTPIDQSKSSKSNREDPDPYSRKRTSLSSIRPK